MGRGGSWGWSCAARHSDAPRQPGHSRDLDGARRATLGSLPLSCAYDQITPRGKKAVLQLYRALTPARFAGWEQKLRGLTKERIPTTVVWGEHDPYIPAEFASRFGTRNIVRFPHSGHWVIAEEAEAVGDHLRSFFTSSSEA